MKKIIKLGIIAFISMLCLTSLMSFVNSQETLPELLTPPTYTYDQGVYTEYATSDNNYRVFLSKTKETIADMIAMSLSTPSIKTKYSFNQFYFDFLLDSQNHYSDTYANAIKPVFDFYVPDTSGNPYYRGKLEMEFRTNDVKVIVYESYYSGTWSTYVATTLKTITYTDYYLNSSTLNNIEFGIHLRLETSGSDTIYKSI